MWGILWGDLSDFENNVSLHQYSSYGIPVLGAVVEVRIEDKVVVVTFVASDFEVEKADCTVDVCGSG